MCRRRDPSEQPQHIDLHRTGGRVSVCRLGSAGSAVVAGCRAAEHLHRRRGQGRVVHRSRARAPAGGSVIFSALGGGQQSGDHHYNRPPCPSRGKQPLPSRHHTQQKGVVRQASNLGWRKAPAAVEGLPASRASVSEDQRRSLSPLPGSARWAKQTPPSPVTMPPPGQNVNGGFAGLKRLYHRRQRRPTGSAEQAEAVQRKCPEPQGIDCLKCNHKK